MIGTSHIRKRMEQSQAEICTLNPLRGKLVDYFVKTKADLRAVKQALMQKSGLVKDPLLTGRLFITRDQGLTKKVAEFAEELKKLFIQAYPTEALMSAILLQHFITGLRAPISCQLLFPFFHCYRTTSSVTCTKL